MNSSRPGALAGIVLERGGCPVVARILVRDDRGEWRVDPEATRERLQEMDQAVAACLPAEGMMRELLASLSPSVRTLLREASTNRIVGVPPAPGATRLGRRLRSLAARAGRQRDAQLLIRLEHGLRFCTGGHTAGELVLLGSLVSLEDAELVAALDSLPPPSPAESPLTPRLSGLLIFRPACDANAGA